MPAYEWVLADFPRRTSLLCEDMHYAAACIISCHPSKHQPEDAQLSVFFVAALPSSFLHQATFVEHPRLCPHLSASSRCSGAIETPFRQAKCLAARQVASRRASSCGPRARTRD